MANEEQKQRRVEQSHKRESGTKILQKNGSLGQQIEEKKTVTEDP